MLDAIIINPPGQVLATIIWLHGLGADGHDFAPVAHELALPAALGVRFVLPHAPKRPVTVNGGYVMRAWYDVLNPNLGQAVDEAGIAASAQEITALIEREIAAGVPPARIILAGFSQGGVIVLETAARFPQPLGGVIALSTYVAKPEKFPAAGPGAPPIFMAHGLQDMMIPMAQARQSRDALLGKGYGVEWQEYPMPHSVCLEEIGAIRAWLLARLK
jgi:phospholipase/carboxylesterase